MRTCDLYLHVASHENCPYAVIEAIAAGLPVMAIASGGIPELVSTTAEESLVGGDADGGQIAERLSAWVRQPDLCASIAKRQYYYARPRFSLSHVLDQTEAYYREIVNAGV